MKKSFFIFYTLFIFMFFYSKAEAVVTWEKTYGGVNRDQATSVQQTTDGGYVMAGGTKSFGAGDFDVYIIKLDANGNKTWDKTYGGAGYDVAVSIQQTTDGGYIVAGYTNSFGAGNRDVYVLKLDNSGNKLWEKTFGGAARDEGISVQQTTDGGYIVAGYTESSGAGGGDVYVIKLDSSGNKIWENTYGGTLHDYAWSVQQTTDGGYIVAGFTFSFGAGNSDVYIIKLDGLGNKIWEKTYGGISSDIATSIQQTSDGGYIATGQTCSFGAGGCDVYVVKLDSLGNKMWENTYGGANAEIALSVQQTTDGGYIVAGQTRSFGAGGYDAYLIKLDSVGNKVWERTYGGVFDDQAVSVRQTNDGGYIVAGYTTSFGAGERDVYVLKLDSLGQIEPVVSSVSPNASPNTVPVSVLIQGQSFKQGATTKLQLTGQPDILGSSIQVLSSTQIQCTFDLTGAARGFYDVVVTNPDGVVGRLVGGFEITGPQAGISSISPNWGVNTGSITVVITGRNFHPSKSTATLKMSGQPDIVGTILSRSTTQIQATFNLTGAVTGLWDVVVSAAGVPNPQNFTTVLPKGFTIYPPTDLEVSKWGTAARSGFNLTYYVSYYNSGAPASNTTVTDTFPPFLTVVSSNPPASVVGNTATWNVGTVSGFSGGRVSVTLNVPGATPPGTPLLNVASIDTSSNEPNKTNNQYTFAQTVVASFDPNDKGVSPQGYITGSETLFYVVRFENIGTADAVNIKVEDKLDANLDENTLSRISDNGVYNPATRTLTWNFENINLPPQGEGLVSFALKPKNNLPVGTDIKNYATIYFDFNPPVNTPAVTSTIAIPQVVSLQSVILKMKLLKQEMAYSGVLNVQDYVAKIDAAISKTEDALNDARTGNNNLAVNMLNAAENQLNALTNAVNAQSGKKIPSEKAKKWLGEIQIISLDMDKIIMDLGGVTHSPSKPLMDIPAQEELKILGVYNYPNPYKGSSSGSTGGKSKIDGTEGGMVFRYKASGSIQSVVIEVYTLNGKRIDRFDDPTIDGEVSWDFADRLSNGVYIYRMTISNGVKSVSKTGKIVILK